MKHATIIESVGHHAASGIWFFRDCAFTTDPANPVVIPNPSGTFIIGDQVYRLGYNITRQHLHREAPRFFSSIPSITPQQELERIQADPAREIDDVSYFFHAACEDLNDLFGDSRGILILGACLAYAMAPELLEKHHCHPGIMITGRTGTGKTCTAAYLMAMWGYAPTYQPFVLADGSTSAFMDLCLSRSSHTPVHFDEFREKDMTVSHLASLRSPFNRNATRLPESITPTTSPLITGEGNFPDTATRSRYICAEIIPDNDRRTSDQRFRRYFEIRHRTLPNLHRIVRYILMTRGTIAAEFMTNLDAFLTDPAVNSGIQSDRLRLTYGSACAMAITLHARLTRPWQSQLKEEIAKLTGFTISYVNSIH